MHQPASEAPAVSAYLRHLAHANRQLQLVAQQQHVGDGEQGTGTIHILRGRDGEQTLLKLAISPDC